MKYASLLVAPLLAAAADEGAAYTYEIEGDTISVTAPAGTRYELESPCVGTAIAHTTDTLYVACGDAGLAVFSLASPSTPQLLGVREMGGKVTGFHQVGEALWVEIAKMEARPLSELPLTPPAKVARVAVTEELAAQKAKPQPTPLPQQLVASMPHTAALGRVVALRNTGVIVDLGSDDGLAAGDHVELFREIEVQLGDSNTAKRQEQIAVGRVVAATGKRAEVELGRNELVPVGALARPTQRAETASRWLPPRAAGLWEVSFHLRPFLALGSFGLGTVNDASVGWRLANQVHLQALFEPLGFGFADAGNVVAAAGNLVGSYDTRFFEIGLGAGWSAVNNDIGSQQQSALAERGINGLDARFHNVRSGLSVAQVARLGSRDGLHLSARNTFLLYKKAFHYGGTVGELLVPVTERTWLLARGGGGASGFAYGELGLRLLLWGNGLADSFFVSATLGGAGLFGEKKVKCTYYDPATGMQVEDTTHKCFEPVNYAGPMVGLGFEWRL